MTLTLGLLDRQGILIAKAAVLRFLCSHLVRVRPKDWPDASETALLEEIAPDSLTFGSERLRSAGQQLLIEAEGFHAEVHVTGCDVREDSFLVRARFVDGYRWSPKKWTPRHLYELKSAPKSKGAGA